VLLRSKSSTGQTETCQGRSLLAGSAKGGTLDRSGARAKLTAQRARADIPPEYRSTKSKFRELKMHVAYKVSEFLLSLDRRVLLKCVYYCDILRARGEKYDL